VAVALVLFIVFVERKGGDPDANAVATTLLPGFQRSRVTGLELLQTNQPPIRLRKQDGLWALDAPLHYPAQTYAAERWLLLLEQAKWVVRLTPEDLSNQGAHLSDFGLAPSQLLVQVHQEGQTIELRLGNRMAVGRQFYIQVGDQPDVFVTDSQLLETLPATARDWRDPALFSFASIAVGNKVNFDRIESSGSNSAFNYTLQPDPRTGHWRVTRPVAARGDRSKIERFLGTIYQWQVEEFVTDDPGTNLTVFGLQMPEQQLAIGRGTNDLLTVQFGSSPADRPDLIYARLLRHTNIVLTARTNLDRLRVPAAFWRDHLLLHLETNRIEEIVGSAGSSNSLYRIRRQTNGAWELIEPELLPADSELVAQFFEGMSSIEVDFEKDVVTDFTPYGLVEPPRQFSFLSWTNGVATNYYPSVSFGTNTTGNAFARRSDEQTVYSIHSNVFFGLPLAHWQWRDRKVWSFTTNEVVRVKIWHEGRTREVLRGPEGRWELAPGSTGVLDLSFDEAIYQMGSLQANRWIWVGQGELGRRAFGFESNRVHRLAIELSRGGILQTNTVEFGGSSSEGLPYAAVTFGDERTWFFEFPPVLYYQFVKSSLSLRDDR